MALRSFVRTSQEQGAEVSGGGQIPMLGPMLTDDDGDISIEMKQHQPTRVQYFILFKFFSTRHGNNNKNNYVVSVVYIAYLLCST